MNTDESDIAAYVAMYIQKLKTTTTYDNYKIEAMAEEFREKLEKDEITVEELVDLETNYGKYRKQLGERLGSLRGGKLTRRTGKRHRAGKKTKRRVGKKGKKVGKKSKRRVTRKKV